MYKFEHFIVVVVRAWFILSSSKPRFIAMNRAVELAKKVGRSFMFKLVDGYRAENVKNISSRGTSRRVDTIWLSTWA